LHNDDLILDDGLSVIGVESSIIDCTKDNPGLLRPGAITLEMIEKTTGFEIPLDIARSVLRSSGLLESHYSPKAKVVIDIGAGPGDGFIAFANIPTPIGAIRLASPENIEEYARVFYQALRMGDHKGLNKISIIQPTGEGLAAAVRDRSFKAAAGK
jgi:L-threonylcarbamoyladenylate synthase